MNVRGNKGNLTALMTAKCDRRSKFSNLSNWKEEA